MKIRGKDLAYLFPSRDLYCPSIVSVYTVPRIRGLSYMRSALYLRARGSKAECKIHCVVFLLVSLAFLRPMNHRLLKSCGETEECLPLLWNVGGEGNSSGDFDGAWTCTEEISLEWKVAGSCIDEERDEIDEICEIGGWCSSSSTQWVGKTTLCGSHVADEERCT